MKEIKRVPVLLKHSVDTTIHGLPRLLILCKRFSGKNRVAI